MLRAVFLFFATLLTLILSGCAKNNEIVPGMNEVNEERKAKSEESRLEITKTFGKKFGFKSPKEDEERKLFEYGYEFFKKESR